MKLPTKTLVNRATVEPYKGTSGGGKPTFGTPRKDVKCRLDANESNTVQRGATSTVIARAVAYFRPEAKMPPQSRITIDGTRYEALDVEPLNGPFRIAGYKVTLG